MSSRTMVVILVLTAAFLAGIVAMLGKGHEALRRWLPALHGGR